MTLDAAARTVVAVSWSACQMLPPFDDRTGWIWFDGAMRPWSEARVHVLTHGLHFGSAVFEGARMYEGRIYKLQAHVARLFNSARILDMTIPFTPGEVAAACEAACARNDLTEAYVRPIAWRGSEMIEVAGQRTKIHVAVAAWTWPSYFTLAERRAGVRLGWAKYQRPPPTTEPVHAKAAGLYMICTLSKHAAEAQGYADAMMLDWRGYVAESTGANVIFVAGDELHTPLPDCFLDGITRRSVLSLARRRGLKICERHILPSELAGFTECFLTGTAAEITPVACVGDQPFVTGPVTTALMADYATEVRRAPAFA